MNTGDFTHTLNNMTFPEYTKNTRSYIMTYTDHNRWLYIRPTLLLGRRSTEVGIWYNTHGRTTEICPDYYIYPLERSIFLIINIMINSRYTPQGQMGLRPSVRFIWTCVYFTESYYDNHTNTTEISPDYYIYSLERSNCLIISIMIDIR